MRTKCKSFLMFIFALTCFSILSGCHTVEGFGKDMQKGGQALERVAKQDGNHENTQKIASKNAE